MTKIIVFSDSHNFSGNMKRVIDSRTDVNIFLHLGDGEKEFSLMQEENYGRSFISIRGNNDYFGSSPAEFTADFEDIKIYMTHGHMFSPRTVAEKAKQKSASVALFGHTHRRFCEFQPPGLYLFNPGSISYPRDSRPPSYGLIEIRGSDILLSHGEV